MSSIKNSINSNRQVLKNMTWVGVLQFVNYLIPLLIIPYIVRILGVDIFGKITYAQNIVSYFTLIINFGFDYSATREIAVNKGDKLAIDKIFWSVIKQKVALLLLTFLGLIILYFIFFKVSDNFTLYLFVFLLNIGIVLYPTWFFQGMEEMGKMAIFNVLIKGFGLILTVFFVRSATDYLVYPFITSLAYIGFGVGALIYVMLHFDIRYVKSSKEIDKNIFNISYPIFLNNLFVSGYTITNLTILGFYVSDKEIGYYSGAFKIIMTILMVTSTPVNMAIYPVISRRFSESKQIGIENFKKIALYLAVVSILISVMTFMGSSFLIKLLLGKEFGASLDLLRIFSILPFLVFMASLFTIQGLYAAGFQKLAPWIGATLGIFCITFNVISIPLFGVYGAAWSWVVSEILEIVLAGGLFYWVIKIKRIN